MNIFLWIMQGFLALVFLYSGISKTVFSEQKLIAMGQTGVKGLQLAFIRFIGVTEILGVIGIIFPELLTIYSVLTPISAFCFALIMPFAAVAHYKLKEYKQVGFNMVLLVICIITGIGRSIY